MDRPLIYAQEQARSTDFLFGQRSAMIGLAKLAEAILGTGTFMSGLGCVPTSPASMSVQVNPGQIFSLENVDSTAFGILAADTTHQILKQGLMLDAVQLACPAPTTSGYSINYLIQVAFQETDTTNVVLPFFNSANPSQPYSGQNNTGTALPTERQDQCIVAVKTGAAAATGSQTTPAPDAGYIGAYVVTVAYGQTTITSTSISTYPNAQFLPSDGVFRGLQLGETEYAVDTGTANAIAISLSPAPTALTDGMVLRVKATNDNTGATTVNPNGLGAIPAYANGAAMVGGEIKAGGYYEFECDATNTVVHLIGSSKGELAVSAGTSSGHAINRGQSLTGGTSTDVTASRAFSSTYTNSSARPIKITVVVNVSATGAALALFVDGDRDQYCYTGTSTGQIALSTVVPPGSTYNAVATSASLVKWKEY